MAKMVIYNGGTVSYGACCSDPTHLKKGNLYEVISEDVLDFQINYTLKEVPGSFDSNWFDELKQTYLSISNQIPVEGNYLENFVRIDNITGAWQKVKRSAVIYSVHLIGINTYEVHTRLSVYILQVIEKRNNQKTSV